jgi:hypothetical protein
MHFLMVPDLTVTPVVMGAVKVHAMKMKALYGWFQQVLRQAGAG